jgi:hypothetical protein
VVISDSPGGRMIGGMEICVFGEGRVVSECEELGDACEL